MHFTYLLTIVIIFSQIHVFFGEEFSLRLKLEYYLKDLYSCNLTIKRAQFCRDHEFAVRLTLSGYETIEKNKHMDYFINSSKSNCMMRCDSSKYCNYFEFDKDGNICRLYAMKVVHFNENSHYYSEFPFVCCDAHYPTATRSTICQGMLQPKQKLNSSCTKRDEIPMWYNRIMPCLLSEGNNITLHAAEEDAIFCRSYCFAENKTCSFSVYDPKKKKCRFYSSQTPPICDENSQLSKNIKHVLNVIGCCKTLVTNSKGILNSEKESKCHDYTNSYSGNVSITKSKANCYSWSNITVLNVKEHYFPDYNFNLTKNKCRNINNDVNGPWCIIGDSNQYEYCDIPLCNKNNLLNKWLRVMIVLLPVIIFLVIVSSIFTYFTVCHKK